MKIQHIHPLTRLKHAITLAVAWMLFALGIYFASNETLLAFKAVFIAFGIEILLLVIGIVVWIKHHLFMHRTLAPRKAIPQFEWDLEKDLLGYKLHGDFKALKSAKVITINTQLFAINNELPIKEKFYTSLHQRNSNSHNTQPTIDKKNELLKTMRLEQ